MHTNVLQRFSHTQLSRWQHYSHTKHNLATKCLWLITAGTSERCFGIYALQSSINTIKPLDMEILKQKLASREAQETGPHRQSEASNAAPIGANNAVWNKSYRQSFWSWALSKKGLRELWDPPCCSRNQDFCTDKSTSGCITNSS